MAGKVEKRREELRSRLIDIAERRIAAEGMGAIKARDLAREAECAVGAIYNVFDELENIVIAVNGRTFQRLGLVVASSIADGQGATPTDQLIAMSQAYLKFASDHPNLWRSLFDLKMSADAPVPEWLKEEGIAEAEIKSRLDELVDRHAAFWPLGPGHRR